ncbi:MAG: trypsin-like peptidase domain-containing protein [Proteobacteria bacterium]|nr:trypsin-like peptidase domain-containing protein [Pseudomonadota bacterium]
MNLAFAAAMIRPRYFPDSIVAHLVWMSAFSHALGQVRLERPARLEKTFVIGTPIKAGLRSTVTSGVVSAIRIEPRSGLSFIQSDAAVSPGNSGGPLLDENGNVIGISVIKIIGNSSEGLNLFIPIDEALEALNLKPKPASSR